MPSRVTPVATPDRGKTEMLSYGAPSTIREPASTTNIRPQSAVTVERSPIRSAASRMCGTAKVAPTLLPVAHRKSAAVRSEEHTSELQSHSDLVCRLLLE